MLIEAEGLGLTLNGHSILSDISVSLGEGEILGLIGPNGAGKTSLLRILASLQRPNQGKYVFAGVDIDRLKRDRLARSVGYLPQGSPAHWPLRVRRVIELGRLPYQGLSRKLTESDMEAVLTASKQTEVEHLLDRIVTTLSGGERTRVLLARLFATRPTVILADEPVAALDPYHQLHVMEILRDHARQGGAVVVVLHDLNHAARFCDRLLLLDKGKVAACGDVRQLLEQDLLQNVYRIDLRVFCDEQGFSLTPWERRSECV